MQADETVWSEESDSATQTIIAVLALAIGLFLALGFRQFDASGLTPSLFGFLLGLLLAAIGAGTLIAGGKTIVRVEPRLRRLVISHANLWRARHDIVRFDDIVDLSIGELGDLEGGSIRYYVVAHLRSGKEKPLYLGFFPDTGKQAMESRRQRLLNSMQTRYLS